MGAGGEDIQFSQEVGDQLGISAEGRQPTVIVKQNHSKPLAVIDAEYFVTLLKGTNETLDNS